MVEQPLNSVLPVQLGRADIFEQHIVHIIEHMHCVNGHDRHAVLPLLGTAVNAERLPAHSAPKRHGCADDMPRNERLPVAVTVKRVLDMNAARLPEFERVFCDCRREQAQAVRNEQIFIRRIDHKRIAHRQSHRSFTVTSTLLMPGCHVMTLFPGVSTIFQNSPEVYFCTIVRSPFASSL